MISRSIRNSYSTNSSHVTYLLLCVSVSQSIRLATIALLGAMLVPSLCLRQPSCDNSDQSQGHCKSHRRLGSQWFRRCLIMWCSRVVTTIPYEVIESPFRQPPWEETLHFRSKQPLPITHRVGPRTARAVVSGASHVRVEKRRFFCGYFGIGATRHWHHGDRDCRTEWMYH